MKSDQELGFDPQALRKKYRAERDKRLRQDANDQYVEIKERYQHFANDPYVESGFTRDALFDEVDVVVIGGGFGGLLAGARMREAGIEDIRIIEKGGDFGGTWYWNRYPGIACDIESYVYLPLLEELDYMPKEKYSRGDEIFDHCRAIAEKFDLYRNACLQTEVTRVRWDEALARWIIETNHGDAMKARFVCLSNGFLQKPKLPGIPGIDAFEGKSFHTSRWDYSYTGGDSNGGLSGLADKRVGIIGTGATAVQCIPHLGESARELYVFQRTPSSIGVRDNRPTDPGWVKSLEPGWQRKRQENFQLLTAGGYAEQDLVADGWTDIVRNLLFVMQSQEDGDLSPEALEKNLELADFMQMEKIRARVAAVVEDPATAESLKPWYRQFCKRPCFHDSYLDTYNRENVTLVDTDGRGVDRITDKGVVVDGREYEIDCLIFATGFEVGTDYSRRSGFDIVGRQGLTLDEKWKAGIRTLHGIHIHGFPNLFMMSIAQSGLTVNFPYISNVQAVQIAYVVEQALERKLETLEVTADAEQAWVDAVIDNSRDRSEFQEGCTPGYYNNEGKPSLETRQNFFYFAGPTGFQDLLAAWRSDGRLEGLAQR